MFKNNNLFFFSLVLFTSISFRLNAEEVVANNDIDYDESKYVASENVEQYEDPYEEVNRTIFKFNSKLDKAIFKPIAKGYTKIVPKWGRDRVGNVLENITMPVTMINSAIQLKPHNTLSSFWIFIINSTLGLFGMFDVASSFGFSYTKQGFEKTFAHYGMIQGPYLVLPVLGPSTFRDASGKVVNIAADPFTYMLSKDEMIVKNAVQLIHYRAENLELTDDIDRISLDPYVLTRSIYLQNMKQSVKDNEKVK